MPKTISVGNTQDILYIYIADNQVIDIKKKIPVLRGTGILIYRFSFRVSDYSMVVCNYSV